MPKRLHFQLEDEWAAQIDELAAADNRSVSNLLELIVMRWLLSENESHRRLLAQQSLRMEKPDFEKELNKHTRTAIAKLKS